MPRQSSDIPFQARQQQSRVSVFHLCVCNIFKMKTTQKDRTLPVIIHHLPAMTQEYYVSLFIFKYQKKKKNKIKTNSFCKKKTNKNYKKKQTIFKNITQIGRKVKDGNNTEW